MADLRLKDAVPLGYALASRVARDAGVRALAIKGPVATLQRVRISVHDSIDVDVWVSPGDRDEFMSRLGQLGWYVSEVTSFARVIEQHSVTVAHRSWPCEIDLHDRFPGLLASPDQSFEAAWAERVTLEVAGAPVVAPARHVSLAIHALHQIRDHGEDLEYLSQLAVHAKADFTEDELVGIGRFARSAGATETLRPFLRELGVDVAVGSDSVESVLAWRTATGNVGMTALPAVFELSAIPVRSWPRRVWRTVMLTESEIRASEPGASSGRLGLMRARLRRLRRGLPAVPSAVRAVRHHRRELLRDRSNSRW